MQYVTSYASLRELFEKRKKRSGFEFRARHKNGEFMSNTHEWCAEGASSVINEMQNMRIGDLLSLSFLTLAGPA
ncbi:MAG: hypothetical protein ACUBOA_04040 [Candidatus Loosdrechtia sp.]|uniref:hypothetical protein n=1 Tax=Candidatus Loosdrechtia sp. TaxID=3101272 RepID=UPI003A678709|nr:MAG: hypothetical protein QY305_07650 [Candidatus Jettenia sp. AMX2]